MVSITHKYVSTNGDPPDSSLIGQTKWNDQHDLTLSQTSTIIGRKSPGAGDAEELSAADVVAILAGEIVKPSDLAPVATSGSYSDLTGKPALGTAAAQDVGYFATAAQGAKADSAVQPGDIDLDSDASIRWAAISEGRGPFSVASNDSDGSGGDPHLYVGYNIAPRAVLINEGERGLTWGIEADYDDGSGHNKMEWYSQYQHASGFHDGYGNPTYVRQLFGQIDKVTNLPTILNLATAGLGLRIGWIDGTGTEEQQVVGKNKVTLTDKLFDVYNVPGGGNTIFELNSNVETPETGLTIQSAAQTGGIHLGARSPATDEPIYIDGKGTLGAIVLNSVFGAPVLLPDNGFLFTLDQDTGLVRDANDRVIFQAHGIPALTLDASVTSAATGLFSSSRAAGGGHRLQVTSTETNEPFYLDGKGASGQIILNNDGRAAVLFPNGSASAPAITFIDDQDCGLYRVGSNHIAIGVGGASVPVLDIFGTAVSLPNAAALRFNDSGGTPRNVCQLFSDNNVYCDNAAGGDLNYRTGPTAGSVSQRFSVDKNGNVALGSAALATTATDGFLYLPTCAGTPTGTPTAKTGRSPVIVDTTNSKLCAYIGGAWKSVTLS